MNRSIIIAPVRKSLTVKAPQQLAFETFTAGIGRWWPKNHSLGEARLRDVQVEPREGGDICQICEDDARIKWGTVLVWDPHSRFVFTWQITGKWQPEPNSDPRVNSEVEVRFTATGPETTLVELEHRNFERMGEEAGNGMRNGVNQGWPGLMELYAAAAGGLVETAVA